MRGDGAVRRFRIISTPDPRVGHLRRKPEQALDDCRRPGPRRRPNLVRVRRGDAQRAARTFGLRQVDDAAFDRRSRSERRRPHLHRQSRRDGTAAGGALDRDGVPELRAVPAPERRREHPVRVAGAQGRSCGTRNASGAGRGPARTHACSLRASHRNCPAASSSAWRSGARSSPNRPFA